MKKIFTLISIFTLAFGSLWAQHDTASGPANWKATPNPNLQDWASVSCSFFGTYEEPDGWNTANSQSCTIGSECVTQMTSGAHNGTYAAILTTLSLAGNMAPGIMTTGVIPTTTSGSITGGIAYAEHPDSIVGWFKYTPQGSDNCFATVDLFGSAANNTDTVAVASFNTAPGVSVSAWKRFSAPFKYRNSDPVANSIWLVCSSGNSTGVANSVMDVQDLAIVINNWTGVNLQSNPDVSISISPNPASGHIVVNTSGANSILSLYDISGRKVSEQKLVKNNNIIDVTSFNDGLYIYLVTDENGASVKTGKLIIQK